MIKSFFGVVALGWATSVHASSQLLDTPALYFGGAEHQPYLDWLADKSIQDRYQSSTFIPGSQDDQGAAIHWKIQGQELLLALAVRASGWAAFGLSQAGGMLGADIVYFEASQPDTLTDAFVVENRFPTPDGCHQDWQLVDTDMTRQGFIMWEGRRKLDTGDPRDHPIVNDSDIAVPAHRVIAAWGDSETIGYHGRNVGRGAIRFHEIAAISTQTQDESDTQVTSTNDFDTMVQSATASFFMGAKDFVIPTDETTYELFCATKNDILAQGVPDQGLHVIAFEPILTPETEKYVHHFTIQASASALDDACDGDDFMEMVYVWAPGDAPLLLPDNLGGPLFGDTGINALEVEIHYNNPDGDVGQVDSSGVRFYVTNQLREHTIGVLQLADPFVELYGEPVGDGLSKHTFTCPGSCSQQALIDEPVTVLREHLHMHGTGVRIVNEQFRDGDKVREGSVEVWEFDQQGNPAVQQQRFEIQPGDSFRTTCYYRDSSAATFGLASSEEMCIAFLFYYPRKLIADAFPWFCGYGMEWFEQCNAQHDFESLPSEAGLGRYFGELSDNPTCEGDATENPTTTAPSSATTDGEPSSGSPNKFKAFVTVALLAASLVVS